MPGGRRPKNSDGRANNGGARQGTPGTPYQNRRDLQTQKPTAAPNQPYGQAGAQLAAQKAVPVAGAAAGVPAAAQPAPGQPAPPWATPADTPNLTDPTQRPDEPVTHGLPFGPGAGPEALGPAAMSDVEARLRALYLAHPTNELRELIRQQDLTR